LFRRLYIFVSQAFCYCGIIFIRWAFNLEINEFRSEQNLNHIK